MYLGPELPHTVTILPQPSVEVLQSPLAALVHLLAVVKGITVLVDGVVSQMHEMLVLQGRNDQ